MRNKEFALRRRKLLEQLDSGSVAIIPAAKEHRQLNYSYQQNGDFYYLTGWVESESMVVLTPARDEGEFVWFSRENDPAKMIWDGGDIGQEKACSELGANQAFPIDEVDKILPQLLSGKNKVYFSFGSDPSFMPKVVAWLNQARRKTDNNCGMPCQLINLDQILHEMRLKKDQSELTSMRKAAEITISGHLRAMQKCRPEMYEYELEAELLYEFNRRNSRCQAFTPIVAGGVNSCIVHYPKNDCKLSAGDLVLVDAGAKYEHYCADVSRTFPVNGRFTPEQRAVYEVVLAAQLEAIKQVRPGVSWDVLQSAAERTITTGLVDLGLLQGEVEDLVTRQEFKQFSLHKTGHWLGYDVHDAGSYMLNDKWRILEPGMVFTIEPGVYISPNLTAVDGKWLGIGVRIEDDVLVTNNGCEILTAALPKDVAEIEKVMRKNK